MQIRRRALLLAVGSLAMLAGCADPSLIGVQDYGTVFGNAVSATGTPLAGAYVSATGTTAVVQTAQNGSFTLTKVAVGEQTVTIQLAGFSTQTADVTVAKNTSTSVGNLKLTSQTATPVEK